MNEAKGVAGQLVELLKRTYITSEHFGKASSNHTVGLEVVYMDQEIKECCDWLHCQLNDIKTFLAGIQKHIEGDQIRFPGGGNLSVPILIYAYLEFISALYCGKSKYSTNGNYNATDNVKAFAETFLSYD